MRLQPVHDGLDAIDVAIPHVVLLAQLRRDVDVGDVVAAIEYDAVKRLEE